MLPSIFRLPALSATLAASLFAAAAHAASPQAATAPPDTLAKIQASRLITIGLRDSAPPFAWVDVSGKPQGFTWELCKAVVNSISGELKVPLQIKVVPATLSESFGMLQNGQIDLQCGSTTHTQERQQTVAFSNTFFVSGIVVAHRKGDSHYASPKEFGRIGTLAGSTAEKAVQTRIKNTTDANFKALVPFPSYEDGLRMLKSGQIDTLAADEQLMPSDPGIALRKLPLTVEPYALMMRRGDAHFVQMVDRALSDILRTPAPRQWASDVNLKINFMTSDAWIRPSKEPAPPRF